jgi:hypothetical protein
MFRGMLTGVGVLCLLAIGGCTAERPAATQASRPAASKAELTAGLGEKVGEISQGKSTKNIVIGPSMTGSLVRGISHSAYADGAATPAAGAAFLGSGQSRGDMIKPADQPLDTAKNYVELLYGYLASIDPGGTSISAEFYEDEQGCESDVITRKGKDGVVRYYLVDSTGFQDKIYEEMGELPDRDCPR